MRKKRFIALCSALAWFALLTPALAGKPLNLGTTKFKEIAKYLNLTAEQQRKIKPDVDRIQDVVKQAARQGGTPGYGGGGRTPVGGGRWGGGLGGNSGAVQLGDREQRRLQRVEWQKEITNRVEEIKSFLTPGQLQKFETVEIPDIEP